MQTHFGIFLFLLFVLLPISEKSQLLLQWLPLLIDIASIVVVVLVLCGLFCMRVVCVGSFYAVVCFLLLRCLLFEFKFQLLFLLHSSFKVIKRFFFFFFFLTMLLFVTPHVHTSSHNIHMYIVCTFINTLIQSHFMLTVFTTLTIFRTFDVFFLQLSGCWSDRSYANASDVTRVLALRAVYEILLTRFLFECEWGLRNILQDSLSYPF